MNKASDRTVHASTARAHGKSNGLTFIAFGINVAAVLSVWVEGLFGMIVMFQLAENDEPFTREGFRWVVMFALGFSVLSSIITIVEHAYGGNNLSQKARDVKQFQNEIVLRSIHSMVVTQAKDTDVSGHLSRGIHAHPESTGERQKIEGWSLFWRVVGRCIIAFFLMSGTIIIDVLMFITIGKIHNISNMVPTTSGTIFEAVARSDLFVLCLFLAMRWLATNLFFGHWLITKGEHHTDISAEDSTRKAVSHGSGQPGVGPNGPSGHNAQFGGAHASIVSSGQPLATGNFI